MDPETLLLDYGRLLLGWPEEDAFRRFRNLQVAAFVQTQSVSQGFRQDYPSRFVHFKRHTI